MTIAHLVDATPVGGINGATTSGIDTTGVNFIVLAVSYLTGTSPTFSDSKSNTWTPLTATVKTGVCRMYYCVSPTVGTGHTFSSAGTATYSSVGAMAFSGVAASPFDQETGNTTDSASTVQAGAITPTENNCLLVAAVAANSSGNITIDGGYTEGGELDDAVGQNFNSMFAYLIQTTAASANPTFSGSWPYSATSHASFKAAAAATTTQGMPFGGRSTAFNGGRTFMGNIRRLASGILAPDSRIIEARNDPRWRLAC